MKSSAIAFRTRCSQVVAESRAVASTRTVAMACLAVCSIGLADARAENAIEESTDSAASNEITCARHGRGHGGGKALRAGGHGTYLVPISGKVAPDVPIWKTITLGTHENANALREALKAARCGVGDLAAEVLVRPQFAVSQSRAKVNLAVLSVADLGFGTAGASRAEIYRRAAQLGLELCPAEVGPQLRLQYADQPLGEFLHIAMEPVVTNGGDAVVGLSVGNGGAGLSLIGGNARPDIIVPPTVRFVFVRHPVGPRLARRPMPDGSHERPPLSITMRRAKDGLHVISP